MSQLFTVEQHQARGDYRLYPLGGKEPSMPNRDVHLPLGALSGAAYATHHAWGQPGP